MKDQSKIAEELSEPFAPNEVKWKPQGVKGNRAMALPYIDARCVEDRLDDVLGPGGWQDSYDVLPDGSVVCRLSIKIGDQWITKADVGSPSEQPDSGDRMKAAFSDALKRAAVKFGIGRYIYRIPSTWCDYDPVKKKLSQTPRLPAFAMPKTPVGRDVPAYDEPGAASEPPTEKVERTSAELTENWKLAWRTAKNDDARKQIIAEIKAAYDAGRLSKQDADFLRNMVSNKSAA